MVSQIKIDELIRLRRELHKYPELSGKEINTGEKIKGFLQKYKPDQVIENIGETGLAFIFEGKEKGPTVLFRCDLDALPIDEINEINYKSRNEGVGHKCGHDGHMTILAGLAEAVSKNRPD